MYLSIKKITEFELPLGFINQCTQCFLFSKDDLKMTLLGKIDQQESNSAILFPYIIFHNKLPLVQSIAMST